MSEDDDISSSSSDRKRTRTMSTSSSFPSMSRLVVDTDNTTTINTNSSGHKQSDYSSSSSSSMNSSSHKNKTGFKRKHISYADVTKEEVDHRNHHQLKKHMEESINMVEGLVKAKVAMHSQATSLLGQLATADTNMVVNMSKAIKVIGELELQLSEKKKELEQQKVANETSVEELQEMLLNQKEVYTVELEMMEEIVSENVASMKDMTKKGQENKEEMRLTEKKLKQIQEKLKVNQVTLDDLKKARQREKHEHEQIVDKLAQQYSELQDNLAKNRQQKLALEFESWEKSQENLQCIATITNLKNERQRDREFLWEVIAYHEERAKEKEDLLSFNAVTIVNLQRECETTKEKLNNVLKLVKGCRESNQKCVAKITEQRKALSEAQANISAKMNIISKLEEEKVMLEKNIHDQQQELNASREENEKLQRRLMKAEEKLRKATEILTAPE